MIRTRYDIARIHRVLVLDEPEAIHEFNLRDFAGAMGVEVVLNIGLGSYIHTVQLALPCQVSTRSCASEARIPQNSSASRR